MNAGTVVFGSIKLGLWLVVQLAILLELVKRGLS